MSAPEKLSLVRSIVGHCEGHEDRALAEIGAVLAGASIADLLRARLGGAA